MPTRYNVDFINPLLEAVVSVLGTMANFSVTPGTPFINRKRTSTSDITGFIDISGYDRGIISLSLSEGAILKIVNNMLAESYTEINNDIADAVGELTNMIAGQARKHLANQGYAFQAGTPSIILGKGRRTAHIPRAPILAIPFSSEHGDLVVEVSFVQKPEET